MKKAVNAIVLNPEKNKILLIKRKSGIHSDKWAFPGGILEKGESTETALKREIKEETGLEINKIIKKIADYEYPRENNELTLGESYLVEVVNNKIKIDKKEISDFKWATIEEIENLDCAPGIKEEALAVFGILALF